MARIVYFAFDLTEASQIRRIAALRELGHDVRSVSFRRGNMNVDFVPDWPNLDLGYMPNQRFAERILRLARAVPLLFRADPIFEDADVIIARNFDLLALAAIARAARLPRATPLIYECLDIHSLFVGRRLVNRVMRFLERWLMSKTALLWVSSPGFIHGYFQPMQGYDGPFALIENKLWFDGLPPPRPRPTGSILRSGPITLGWVGSIRCAASLDILAETARRLGPKVRVEIHGNVHSHALPHFDAVIAELDNVTWHGPYRYPDDLGRVYCGCDAVWAQDLWQRGGNSDWLLPNRIYEASWFGCPSIAVADTETGRRVTTDGLGLTIQDPSADALEGLLSGIDIGELRAMRAQLLAIEDDRFRLRPADVAAALAPVLTTPPDAAPAESPAA
ncbi:MAG: glycosyltransferase [Pseudomonadota bacterium]